MKPGSIIVFVLLSLSFLISACQDDAGKNNYSGVGDLIAERNKARYEVAENPSASQSGQVKVAQQKPRTEQQKNDELASAILYEQNVRIVGSDSGRTLADGVAYINKKGQIVRIKILKE